MTQADRKDPTQRTCQECLQWVLGCFHWCRRGGLPNLNRANQLNVVLHQFPLQVFSWDFLSRLLQTSLAKVSITDALNCKHVPWKRHPSYSIKKAKGSLQQIAKARDRLSATHLLHLYKIFAVFSPPAVLYYSLELTSIRFPEKGRKLQKKNVNIEPVLHNCHKTEPGNLGQST